MVLLFAVDCSAQSRSLDSFSSIHVRSSISVKLVKADVPKVEFKMIKGSESNLITRVNGSELIVKIKNNRQSRKGAQAKVTVYYTELTEISVSDGASIKTEEAIQAKDFDIDVSSGSSANIEITAKNINAEASSGATLKLKGAAESGNYQASSGSNINAKYMICDYVDADVSSGASIRVHVNKKLNADASSGGSIKYTGDADDNDIESGWTGQISRI